MNKYIILTTIQTPTEATIKFSQLKDWKLIVVGDLKTPHDSYKDINCIYLHPNFIKAQYSDFIENMQWNQPCIRSVGFIEAYKQGADILALVDDDNIPYDNWGEDLLVNQEVEVDCYDTPNLAFDPLSVTNYNHLWHRGYPIQLLKTKNNIEYIGKIKRKILVQANLWDGDPDIDAIERLIWNPIVKFNIKTPYCSTKISPFNSQNTFISREVIPYYMALPGIGRMDDIWASYILQQKFSNSVIYSKPTVYQKRNIHNLLKDMENEIFGYNNTLKLLENKVSLSNYNRPSDSYYLYMKEF
jgi:hypothetical protein